MKWGNSRERRDKEEGEWRLSGMIRLGWGSDRVVLRNQWLKTCSVFSPLIKMDLYLMNLQWDFIAR